VSILMPVYNCENFIAASVQSILDQTHTNFELIIIDDKSTDRTVEIISSFRDKRIKFFLNKKNIGITATLNAHLRYCKGTLTARMDGDDIAYAQRIERQVGFLEKNKQIDLLGSYYIIKKSGNIDNIIVRRQTDDKKIRFHMLFRNQFLHPAVMIKTKLLHQLRYRDVSTCEDYDLWARCLKYARVANCPEILMIYRWHGQNVSIINQPALRKSIILIISELLNEYEVEHTQEELLLQTMIALGFEKEHLSILNKLEPMALWLNKLRSSEALNRRFGTSFLNNEIREYFDLYEFDY
ncbi:MAG TPA: glycosyltransferase, partial [Flavobacterium sp.]|nr:glycosyltransferase [Flavobacterium sp.]